MRFYFTILVVATALTVSAGEVSIVSLDAVSGHIDNKDWEGAEEPIAVGSLLKPFAALAYARSFSYAYPAFGCDGEQCWLPSGHGEVNIGSAIAYSCNSYFHQLSLFIDPTQLAEVAAVYGLQPPPPDAEPDWYFGLGPWTQSPRAMLNAYLELWRRRAQPGVRPLVDGLRDAARFGTARSLGDGVLAKTGTSVCGHGSGHGARKLDGFAILLAPEHAPATIRLIRLHNATGREAAEWLARK